MIAQHTTPAARPNLMAVPESGRLHDNTLLTAEQLAERWQVKKTHVYRLARDGAIPVVPIGRYYRFRLAAIEAWEMAQERGEAA